MKTYRRLALAVVLGLCLMAPAAAQAADLTTFRTVKSWNAALAPAQPVHSYCEPAISGDWVVYRDDDGVVRNVWALNLRTGEDFPLRAQAAAQSAPSISGTKVVWSDRRNNDNNIYLCDLSRPSVITTIAGGPLDPGAGAVISGNYVVYNNNDALVLHNIATKARTIIEDGSRPSISGDWVVYQTATTPSNIHAYRISTDQVVNVTQVTAGNQSNPDISDGIVAWEKTTTAGVNIAWKHVLSMGSDNVIPTGGVADSNPTVSGTRIFFKSDFNDGNPALSMYDTGSGNQVTPLKLSAMAMMGDDRFEDARPYGDTLVFRQGRDLMWVKIYAPTLALTAPPAVVNYNSTIQLRGSISDYGVRMGGIDPLPDVLQYESSGDGLSWIASTNGLGTDSNGIYSKTITGIKTKTWFRTKYVGAYDPFTWDVHLSALSPARVVIPRASLGKPTVPTTIARNAKFTAWNYVAPVNGLGAKSVKVEYWRYESGHFRLKKSVWAPTSYYSSAKSKYKASTTLGSGKWRMRAVYPTSATNYNTRTSWVYRTVQ